MNILHLDALNAKATNPMHLAHLAHLAPIFCISQASGDVSTAEQKAQEMKEASVLDNSPPFKFPLQNGGTCVL